MLMKKVMNTLLQSGVIAMCFWLMSHDVLLGVPAEVVWKIYAFFCIAVCGMISWIDWIHYDIECRRLQLKIIREHSQVTDDGY